MKKLYLTIFSLVILSATLFAQEYDINSYNFRYQKYKGFTLNPSLYNNANHSFANQNNPNYINSQNFNNQTSMNGNLNLQGNYFSTQNVEKMQQFTNISIGNRATWNYGKSVSSNANDENYKNKNWSNNTGLNYNQVTRLYNTENTFKYRDKNATLYTNLNSTNTDRNGNRLDISIRKGRDIGTSLSASFGKGSGRLNNVSDVVAAYFLLNDLREKIGIKYTNDQLEQMAYGITFIRNQRYLDFRFRTIDQLTMLDSLLSINSLKSENDVAYFSTINDNLLYATNLNRFSGKRWTFYYTPGIDIASSRNKEQRNYSWNSNVGIDTVNTYNLSYINRHALLSDFTIEYINSTQKSWKVQQSFSTNLTIGTRFSSNFARDSVSDIEFIKPIRDSKIDDFNNQLYVRISATLSHLYQPNSRTYYIASITPSVNFNDYRLSTELLQDWEYQRNSIIPSMNFDFNYYKWLNQNLAFNARASASFITGMYNATSTAPLQSVSNFEFEINHNISAGFTYQLY